MWLATLALRMTIIDANEPYRDMDQAMQQQIEGQQVMVQRLKDHPLSFSMVPVKFINNNEPVVVEYLRAEYVMLLSEGLVNGERNVAIKRMDIPCTPEDIAIGATDMEIDWLDYLEANL